MPIQCLGQVHEIFTDRLVDLMGDAFVIDAGIEQQGQRRWQMPRDWSGIPYAHEDLINAYDRSSIETNYAQVIADSKNPGTSGDVVSLKTQGDYLACQERALRARLASSIRGHAMSAARRKGQADPKGIFQRGLLRYVQDAIVAGTK